MLARSRPRKIIAPSREPPVGMLPQGAQCASGAGRCARCRSILTGGSDDDASICRGLDLPSLDYRCHQYLAQNPPPEHGKILEDAKSMLVRY